MPPTQVETFQNTYASESALVGRARSDPEAFAELYRRHFPRVYRYHIAHTGNIQDAQDLTTQTFLAALESLESFRGAGNFAAWLLGIARRKMALHYRSRQPEIPLEEAWNLPDPAPLPEIVAGAQLQLTRISQALAGLAPDRAEALVLCIFSGLSAVEAASLMAKTEAAVKMLVYRGIKDLRDKLALVFQEEKQ